MGPWVRRNRGDAEQPVLHTVVGGHWEDDWRQTGTQTNH